MVVSKRMTHKERSVACAWAGKTGGAIWVCLDFWAPPFASRQKVEYIHYRQDKNSKVSYSNASPDPAGQSATSSIDNKQTSYLEITIWTFEKVYFR
jgi:hypothetical protein